MTMGVVLTWSQKDLSMLRKDEMTQCGGETLLIRHEITKECILLPVDPSSYGGRSVGEFGGKGLSRSSIKDSWRVAYGGSDFC